MAKKSMIERDKKRRRLEAKYKDRAAEYRKAIKDPKLPLDQKFEIQLKLSGLPRDASKCRQRNRCVLTGRPRGYYRHFGLCRIMLRELAAFGQIPGLKKSSW